MKNTIMNLLNSKLHFSVSAWIGRLGLLLLPLVLAGCEAPLNLDQVVAEGAKTVRRYDMFQAVAEAGNRVVVVSSVGAALVSDDKGVNWERYELSGRPSLIDVTACDNGDFFALDSQHRVWQLPAAGSQWVSSTIDTLENTLAIECAPGNRLWVSASFSTLYSRDLQSQEWQEFSLSEDLQFTSVKFVDELNGYAVGEFGTVLSTTDGGENWSAMESLPNEFYPMAADFLDATTGWIGGLDGVIWQTEDGGMSWQRQETLNASPIYNIQAGSHGIYASGGSAKLVEFSHGRWQKMADAPEVLTYIRGLAVLSDGSLLVAGGGGTLAVVPADHTDS
tara:strand:+ start:108599 stop:109603 length:1005 start_codon:yes stop_codon:yes gene_type:complete